VHQFLKQNGHESVAVALEGSLKEKKQKKMLKAEITQGKSLEQIVHETITAGAKMCVL
jgi:hypothetical protein